MKSLWFLWVVTLSVSLFGRVGNAAPITEAMQRADPALKKQVSVSGYRLYVGELLEHLSEETDVVLIASPKDRAADQRVSVVLRDASLAAALNALRSALSYRNASYEWEREKSTGGKWQYRLVRARANRELSNSLQTLGRQKLAEEVAKAIEKARTFDETKLHATEPDAFKRGIAKRNNYAWQAVDSLLTSAQLREAISDSRPFQFGLNELNDAGKKHLAAGKEISDANRADHPETAHMVAPFVEATGMIFRVDYEPGEIAPSFNIFRTLPDIIAPPGSGRASLVGMYEGGGYVAGMREKMDDALSDLWRLRDDQPVASKWREEASVATTKEAATDSIQQIGINADLGIAYSVLKKWSKQSNASFVAHLPHNFSYERGVKTKNILSSLEQSGIDFKQRGGILIATYHAWFTAETFEAEVPWAVVKKLRTVARQNNGVLTDQAIYSTASVLNETQLTSLLPDSGHWKPDNWEVARTVLQLYPLFSKLSQLSATQQATLRTEGIALSELPKQVQNFVFNDLEKIFDRTRLSSAVPGRVRVVPTESSNNERRYLTIAVLDSQANIMWENSLSVVKWSY